MTQQGQDSLSDSKAPQLQLQALGEGAVFNMSGDWTIETLASADKLVSDILKDPVRPVRIELDKLENLDTSGAWAIIRLFRAIDFDLTQIESMKPHHRTLFEAVAETNHIKPEPKPHTSAIGDMFEAVGASVAEIYRDILILAHLTGGLIYGLVQSLFDIRKLRITSIAHHIEQAGLKAVPIVALMSFLIGAIVAQQGAFQLRKFGAEPFVIDLVGILVLREVGLLLTAILVAGRSGSAFTAEIGSMRMREEVDALKVMGLSITQVLITPRVLALIISLPLLGIVSNVSALTGAGLLLWVYSDITPASYITWLRDAVALNTFFVGVIKAPFMALIIALISCAEGLRVGGSAESLGKRTTAAVVKSIFLVVLVDGVFAIYFAAIDY